jgi:P-type Cu2+ transporter
MQKINLNISGMTCVNCSQAIEKLAHRVDGIASASVSFANSSGEFEIDDKKIDKGILINKINSLGFQVEKNIKIQEQNRQKNNANLTHSFLIASSFTVFIFLSSFLYQEFKPYISFVLAGIVVFYAGRGFFILAYKSLLNKNTDMNVLVALGVSVSYFYSSFVLFAGDLLPPDFSFVYFDGAAMIISFVLLGRLLESRSKDKTHKFLQNMLKMTPQTAYLLKKDGRQIKTKIADLKINDKIVIKAGDTIPADAVIFEGQTQIDTSSLTGEPLSVFADVDDKIKAGTINIQNPIKAVVASLPKDTTLAKIVRLLKEAQGKKMPIARLADKIAFYFVPSVILVAVITFVAWVVLAQNYTMAILSFISVLIISCPCALGLATPIAIVAGVSAAAKVGIILKNPVKLEMIKNIKYSIFDKTGTLTTAQIRVVDAIYQVADLQLILAIEKLSEHPVARALVDFCQGQDNVKIVVKNYQTITGVGVSAQIENKEIVIGHMGIIKKHKIKITDKYKKFYQKHTDNGQSVIFVAINGILSACFALGDTLKPGAKILIDKFKKQKIKTIMLSGDNKKTCKYIADEIGVEKFYAELMPDEKLNKIKNLQKEGCCLFVGDGINDALSIHAADVGIAYNSGSDISAQAGDIVLMNNNLKTIYQAFEVSQKTINTIKQNLFWAFFYNIIAIPVAAGVLYPFYGFTLTPAIAALAMSFSSITVVLNSLRIKSFK